VGGHLELLCILGGIPRDQATTALQLFDDRRAMTWRLVNTK
jgi:hypothetical protein